MSMSLAEAPAEQSMALVGVDDPGLEQEFRKLGLFHGARIVKLGEESVMKSMRVLGPEGEVILSGRMASGIYVHLDDGRKLPLPDLEEGNEGHVEGLTCNEELARTLAVLGLSEGCRVRMIRVLPPMDYVTIVNGRDRVRMIEGMAAKIWGRNEGRSTQYAQARVKTPFVVESILGGSLNPELIRSLGIETGKTLELEGVTAAKNVAFSDRKPVIVSGEHGLRLFIHPRAAESVRVCPRSMRPANMEDENPATGEGS